MVDLPLYLIEPVILTTILYWMVGLNPDLVRFFVACGIILLVTQVSAFYSIVLIHIYMYWGHQLHLVHLGVVHRSLKNNVSINFYINVDEKIGFHK